MMTEVLELFDETAASKGDWAAKENSNDHGTSMLEYRCTNKIHALTHSASSVVFSLGMMVSDCSLCVHLVGVPATSSQYSIHVMLLRGIVRTSWKYKHTHAHTLTNRREESCQGPDSVGLGVVVIFLGSLPPSWVHLGQSHWNGYLALSLRRRFVTHFVSGR